jgi:hypothetical protein
MAFEALNKILFNKETGLYSIVEAGFRYEIPESLFDNLKRYIVQHDLVSRWYKQLSNIDLQKVNKINAYSNLF